MEGPSPPPHTTDFLKDNVDYVTTPWRYDSVDKRLVISIPGTHLLRQRTLFGNFVLSFLYKPYNDNRNFSVSYFYLYCDTLYNKCKTYFSNRLTLPLCVSNYPIRVVCPSSLPYPLHRIIHYLSSMFSKLWSFCTLLWIGVNRRLNNDTKFIQGFFNTQLLN